MPYAVTFLALRSAFLMLSSLLLAAPAAAVPAIEGYADDAAMADQLEAIAQSPLATLTSLGTTAGGRDIPLLTLGTGDKDAKPGLLILGNVEGESLLGSELAVRLAQRLVDTAETDTEAGGLLDRATVYLIPRPTPDASAAFFQSPHAEPHGNLRPVDDDHDGEMDENGPADLNGDGWITMMRVEDPTGTWMPHPDDPRVMIEADPKRGEKGRYLLYPESRDTDGDEQYGEDPPGGVEFNRNFPFAYPYFERGAGPHQVSEPETQAVADFAFAHPNLFAVFAFTDHDNLMHPWKPGDGSKGRIKTAVLAEDADYFNHLAKQYQEIHGGKDAPERSSEKGAFTPWTYFHFGRWSVGTRGWWIPKVDAEPKENDEPKDENTPKRDQDKRGRDALAALRWFDREKIAGFVNWTPIEHPGFPDRRVEVGGFKPFLQRNPPARLLPELAEKHATYVCRLIEQFPKLQVRETKAERLGAGVWRVTATVANPGYLPSVSAMGEISTWPQPLQIEIELPEGASLLTGHRRVRLPRLTGSGGSAEQSWLIRAASDAKPEVRIHAWSPSVGSASAVVTMKERE